MTPDPKPDPFADIPGPRDPNLPETQVLEAPEDDEAKENVSESLGDTPEGLEFEDTTAPNDPPVDEATLDEPDVPDGAELDLAGVPSPEDWEDDSSTVVDPVPPDEED